MKQRISVEDLTQLTPEQQEKLREWWSINQQQGDVFICLGNDFLSGKVFAWDGHNKPFKMAVPLVSIGQCIELINERDKCINLNHLVIDPIKHFEWEVRLRHLDFYNNEIELIDSLWQAVKEIL